MVSDVKAEYRNPRQGWMARAPECHSPARRRQGRSCHMAEYTKQSQSPEEDKAETASPRERPATVQAGLKPAPTSMTGRAKQSQFVPALERNALRRHYKRARACKTKPIAGRQGSGRSESDDGPCETKPIRSTREEKRLAASLRTGPHAKQSQFRDGGFTGQPGASEDAHPTAQNKANSLPGQWWAQPTLQKRRIVRNKANSFHA